MKYTLVNQGTENSMRLQSIGIVQGTPAKKIKAGDLLMWNFGSVYKVNKIIKETEKTLLIETSPKNSDTVYQQKLNKERLVCILSN
jgi:hypothetical protein